MVLLRCQAVKNLHKRIISSKTPFGQAAVCALIIGVGDLIATLTDLIWLIGDMTRDAAPYHPVVGAFLGVAFLIMGASYIWLYRSINLFLAKRDKKAQKKVKKDKTSGPRARRREQAINDSRKPEGLDELTKRKFDRW